MAKLAKKVRVASNPRRATKKSRPNAARKNRSKTTMAKKRKAAANGKKARRRSNPTKMVARRRRRNPSGLAGTIGSPKELVTASLAALASAVATRQIPQMVLSTSNTGVEGYAANAVTALASTWLVGTFMGPAAGRGALVGGMVILLDRILSDQISPISSYLSLSGVGDAQAYSKLGTIRTGFYTHPNLQNPDGSMYVPDPITADAVAAVAAAYPQIAGMVTSTAASTPPATGGGRRMGAVNPSALRRHTASGQLLSSRFQTRFNS